MDWGKKLKQIRQGKHWTQAEAAEKIGVDVKTLGKWERGASDPRGYNEEKIREVYEMSPAGDNVMDVTRFDIFDVDLTTRLFAFVFAGRSKNIEAIQNNITREIRKFDQMSNDRISRREALQRVATFPLTALQISSYDARDTLSLCASGVTACEYMSKGSQTEMDTAFWAPSAYLSMLQSIIKNSSSHRKEASRLAAQCLLIRATLGVHRESPRHATAYVEQASIYARESGDLPLLLTILKRGSWIYSCDKRSDLALKNMLEAEYLMNQAKVPISPQIQAHTYSGIAKHQAGNGHRDKAILALDIAYQSFYAQPEDEVGYVDGNLSTLIMDDGLTHYHAGQYHKALDSFAQAIDLETLAPKVPLSSERIYCETINYAALASLKLADKDMEHSIQLWKAGMQGSISLQSEQRYNEALTGLEIMQGVWPKEPRVMELRELVTHW